MPWELLVSGRGTNPPLVKFDFSASIHTNRYGSIHQGTVRTRTHPEWLLGDNPGPGNPKNPPTGEPYFCWKKKYIYIYTLENIFRKVATMFCWKTFRKVVPAFFVAMILRRFFTSRFWCKVIKKMMQLQGLLLMVEKSGHHHPSGYFKNTLANSEPPFDWCFLSAMSEP